MTTLILIIGCTFIAGVTAALLSANFFAGALAGLVLGTHATVLNYYKFSALDMSWMIYLVIPLMLIFAVFGAGLGTSFSGSDSEMMGNDSY